MFALDFSLSPLSTTLSTMSTTVYLLPAILLILMVSVQTDGAGAKVRKWAGIKYYQYQTTFGLYMMTPIEQRIFNVVVVVATTLVSYAAYYYLPSHLKRIVPRLFYYAFGPDSPELVSPATRST